MATVIWNEKKEKWSLRVQIDGVAKEFSCKKPGIQGKKEVLKKYREYIERGSTSSTKLTVRVAYGKFLESAQNRLGENSDTYIKHERHGRLYILPAVGPKKVHTLTKADFQEILNTAEPHDKRTAILSKKTLQNIRESINAFVNYCVDNGYIEPFYGSPLYIPKGHPTIGKEIIQPNDIRELLKPSDLHYHKAICFLVCTGLRPSECLGLKWSDIDRDVFRIRRGINTRNIITEGKNKNAKRIVPLTAIARQILALQKEETQHLRSEWVFCNMVGGPGNQHTMYNQMIALGKERGFHSSPYGLRHTFASLFKDSNMSEFMFKQIFGHSASMDTFGVYGHMVDGDMKKAADVIELKFKNLEDDVGN